LRNYYKGHKSTCVINYYRVFKFLTWFQIVIVWAILLLFKRKLHGCAWKNRVGILRCIYFNSIHGNYSNNVELRVRYSYCVHMQGIIPLFSRSYPPSLHSICSTYCKCNVGYYVTSIIQLLWSSQTRSFIFQSAF